MRCTNTAGEQSAVIQSTIEIVGAYLKGVITFCENEKPEATLSRLVQKETELREKVAFTDFKGRRVLHHMNT